jgi:hypothetical protein
MMRAGLEAHGLRAEPIVRVIRASGGLEDVEVSFREIGQAELSLGKARLE